MPTRVVLLLVTAFAGVAAVVFWAERQQIARLRRTDWEARQADEAALAALDKEIACDGRRLSLSELARFLSEQTGVPVELDRQALAVASIDANRQVRLPAGKLSGRAILSLVLSDPFEPTYEVYDGAVHITTLEEVESSSRLALSVYPTPQPGLTAMASEDQWRELVTTVIEPHRWDEVGGMGHVEAVPGGLAVVQTRQVHDQVGALFTRLGAMENPPRTWQPVRLVPLGPSAADQRIATALDQVTSIDVRNRELSGFIADVAEQYDIPACLNQDRLEDAGVSPLAHVSVTLKDASLRSILQAALQPLGLVAIIRHELLLVTTPEDAEAELTTIAYPVHDLVAASGHPDFDSLTEVVTSTVHADMWDDVGGVGTISGIARGWLIVSQTDAVHEDVRMLIETIRQTLNQSSAGPYPLWQRSAAGLRIEEALEQEIAFDYFKTELTAVCDDLSAQLGINVRLDVRRMEEAGIDGSMPIICEFARAPLRVQLRRLCDALDMDIRIANDALWLTTPEDAEERLDMRVYDVRPLVDPDIGLTDIETIKGLMMTHVAPDSWSEVGGPAPIHDFRDLLIIPHTLEVHRSITSLLQGLETHCLPRDSSKSQETRQPLSASLDPAVDRMRRALAQPVEVDFRGATLEQAVERLAGAWGVPITVEWHGLEEAGVDPRTPVDSADCEITLGGVLESILRPHGLAIWTRAGELIVTSQDRANRRLQTALYRVGDLTAGRPDGVDGLTSRIYTELDPQHWDTVGGPGTLAELEPDYLVATTTLDMHRRLETWLATQRGESPPQGKVAQPTTRQVFVPARDAKADDPYAGLDLSWLLGGSARLAIVHVPPAEPPDAAPAPNGRAPAIDPFADPFATPPAVANPAADSFGDPFAAPFPPEDAPAKKEVRP